jgi:hypothetical protein
MSEERAALGYVLARIRRLDILVNKPDYLLSALSLPAFLQRYLKVVKALGG